MLKLANILKKYNKKTVLEFECLEFNSTGLYLIKGESGSGKSTLLNLIANIDKDYTGSISYDDVIIKKDDNAFRKNIVSYMSNDYDFIDCISIKQNFEYLRNLYEFSNDDLRSTMANLNLDIDMNKKVSSLSGGQKQRLMIVKNIVLNKPVMIFDEPTANLDAENEKNVWEVLEKLSTSHLVIVASHSDYKADNIISLDSGLLNCKFSHNDPISYRIEKGIRNNLKLGNYVFRKNTGILSKILIALNTILFMIVLAAFVDVNYSYKNMYDKDAITLNSSGYTNDTLRMLEEDYDNGIISKCYLSSSAMSAHFSYGLSSIQSIKYDETINIYDVELCDGYPLLAGVYTSNQYVIGKNLADELIHICKGKINYDDLIGMHILNGRICGVSSKRSMCAYVNRNIYEEDSLPSIYNYIDGIGSSEFEDYTIVYGADLTDTGYIINASDYPSMTPEEIYNYFNDIDSMCIGVFEYTDSSNRKFSKLKKNQYLNKFNGSATFGEYSNDIKVISGHIPMNDKEIIVSAYSGLLVGDSLLGYKIVGTYNSVELSTSLVYTTSDGVSRYNDISCLLYALYSDGYMSHHIDDIRFNVIDMEELSKQLAEQDINILSEYKIASKDHKDYVNKSATIYTVLVSIDLVIIVSVLCVLCLKNISDNRKNIGTLTADGNSRISIFSNYMQNIYSKDIIYNIVSLVMVLLVYMAVYHKYNVISLSVGIIDVVLYISIVLLVELMIIMISLLFAINKNIISSLKKSK